MRSAVPEVLPDEIDVGLADLAELKRQFNQFQPEIVFHLAAQAIVRQSYQAPIETYEVNVMGTANVLEAVRNCDSCRVALVVTSDKCYENREWDWGYRECDPMGGHDPYSSSKGCAELVTSAYRRSFFGPSSERGVAVASARAGNVIGGGDFAKDRLVPDLVNAMRKHSVLTIRYPDAVRPWQHVLEPLSGYLTLARRLWDEGEAFAEGWNLGPRDQPQPPLSPMAGRLDRASRNFRETFPLFAAAVLIADASNRHGIVSVLGAHLYFFGRLVYLPLYATGVRYFRTLVWMVATLGLVLVIAGLLVG